MASLPILLAAVATVVFIYNVLLFLLRPAKPLPPGPRGLPIVGNLYQLGNAPHRSTAAMSKIYGPLIHLKLGFKDLVLATSASMAAEFFRTHDSNFLTRPSNLAAKHFAYDHQDLVFAEGARWKMLRKICSIHLFSGKALDDSRHIRQEEMTLMVCGMASTAPDPVNLHEMLSLSVANTMGRVLLGKRVFGDGTGRTDGKSTEFQAMVMELMVGTDAFNIADFIPMLEWLDPNGVIKKMKRLHKWFDGFLTSLVNEHKATSKGEGSMLGTLLSLQDVADEEGGRLTERQIKAVLLDLFITGSDPTSATVVWVMAELIRNPHILARVQDEVDSVAGRDRLVTEQDLPRLTYLHAVVKEAFRLHPTTSLPIPRKASESCEVSGYHIPRGATLIVNVWAIGRDPKIWSEPLAFRPERFLPGGEGVNMDVRGNDFEVMPFGSGRRMCVGMNLAIRMVQHLTAALAQAFDWELPNGQEPEKLNMDEAIGITLQRAEPLVVHPKPRLAPHVYN